MVTISLLGCQLYRVQHSTSTLQDVVLSQSALRNEEKERASQPLIALRHNAVVNKSDRFVESERALTRWNLTALKYCCNKI